MVDPSVIRQHLHRRGGLTVDPCTGQRPERGIAVCPDHHLSWPMPWPVWDERRVGQWVEFLAATLGPGRYLGAWLEPRSRRAWVEAVVVLPARRRHQALQLAARAGQRAVYDLDHDRVVFVPRRRP